MGSIDRRSTRTDRATYEYILRSDPLPFRFAPHLIQILAKIARLLMIMKVMSDAQSAGCLVS